MRIFNNKLSTALGLLLGCCLALSAQANDQREYHQSVYESGCESCHDQGPGMYPSDDTCLQCHDIDDLVEQTVRSEEEKWQNPHNSLHYGKELPCVECHAEHMPKQPMCNNCHSFKYDKHQQ